MTSEQTTHAKHRLGRPQGWGFAYPAGRYATRSDQVNTTLTEIKECYYWNLVIQSMVTGAGRETAAQGLSVEVQGSLTGHTSPRYPAQEPTDSS
ncbi:hypothetical protein BKA66DRAFT_461768 [Pyrenochaeta sp. MPI-SDFR-AT-0127]|nr:hypothetical protein BKA66DRAFT_461768 [Pyrenochaeta sp. MPI-SDFR-AT-0127]